MLKFSAVLGIVAALAMTAVKTILAETLWWPFAIVEYLAAFLLLAGAVLVFRKNDGRVLMAGWGFTAATTWSTLFHHAQGMKTLACAGPLEFGLAALLASAGVAIAAGCAARMRP